MTFTELGIKPILSRNADLAVRSQLLIGGVATKRQVEKLKKKPHIVVGSAGRVLELMRMRKLKVHAVKSIVIDEADKLLFGDNLAETQSIINATLKQRRLIFVSATARKDSVTEARALVEDLVMVNASSNLINADIEHFYAVAHKNDKVEILRQLINAYKPERAIVFVHHRPSLPTRTENHHETGHSQTGPDRCVLMDSPSDFPQARFCCSQCSLTS